MKTIDGAFSEALGDAKTYEAKGDAGSTKPGAEHTYMSLTRFWKKRPMMQSAIGVDLEKT